MQQGMYRAQLEAYTHLLGNSNKVIVEFDNLASSVPSAALGWKQATYITSLGNVLKDKAIYDEFDLRVKLEF